MKSTLLSFLLLLTTACYEPVHTTTTTTKEFDPASVVQAGQYLMIAFVVLAVCVALFFSTWVWAYYKTERSILEARKHDND